MFLFMMIMPESPRHLVNVAKDREALKALRWLRGEDFDCRGELKEIRTNLASQPSDSLTAKEFFRREVIKPLVIGVGLMFFQDASGINAVLFYADPIMENAGFQGRGGLASVVIAAILVVTVFPATALTDRAGRKTLLIISQVFIVLSLVCFGLYSYMTAEMGFENLAPMSMTSLIVFIAAFCLGMGPIAYVVVGEIFPMRVRAVATSITVCVHWIIAFIITKTFDIMLKALKPYGTFWFYAGFALIGLIFTIVIVPETKGKSLEEIEAMFTRKPAAETDEKKRPLAAQVDDEAELEQAV
jgi:sugar porter (SP) family MFS transporter